ncbi:MAG: 3'-5' exonuclease domain-containing protein 2 [Burkholderiales bacterium]|nr:3'-5' exonuclease domain-containing protein 2 [Burkholderiales bacterium]
MTGTDSNSSLRETWNSRSISREELASLPIRRHEGEVQLVATIEELERAREDILSERVVGFDTETRPAFRPGVSYPPCLLQAATARAVYLFRFEVPGVHAMLAGLLEDERIVKAGIATGDDLRGLKQVFAFVARNVVDLGVVARRSGMGQTGLRNLAGIFLGFRIPKGARTTNWALPRLTPAQITYAATDAWACRELYLCFERKGLL